MRVLRLGTLDLPASETGLIRALLLLFAQDIERFPWIFASEGPFDALVVDARNSLAISSDSRSLKVRILTVCDTGPADGSGAIARPIEAARLEKWLKSTAQSLLSMMRLEWPIDANHRAGVHPTTHAQRFRLLRWPPTALLQRDKARIRMATLIAKRPMTVNELSDISGETEDRCNTFLRLLQGFSLLEIQRHAASPVGAGHPPGAPTDPRAPPANGPAPQHTLVDSIRRRIGAWAARNERV